MNNRIIEIRNKIDEIDKEIFDLIEKRAKLVIEIAKIKKEESLPEEDLNREKEIFAKINGYINTKISKEYLNKIYKNIILFCKKVAY